MPHFGHRSHVLIQYLLPLGDVIAAEKTEERLSMEKVKLEEELNEARCRAETSSTLVQHLQYTISALQSMLHHSTDQQCNDIVSSNNDINASLLNDSSLGSGDVTQLTNNSLSNDGVLSETSPNNPFIVDKLIISDEIIKNSTWPNIYEDVYEDFTKKKKVGII